MFTCTYCCTVTLYAFLQLCVPQEYNMLSYSIGVKYVTIQYGSTV